LRIKKPRAALALNNVRVHQKAILAEYPDPRARRGR
jgi:hypothetical protein